MRLKEFARSMNVEGTAAENRKIMVMFCDKRSFVTTAKELDNYCNIKSPKEINGIKIGGFIGNYTVVKFNPIVLTDKDASIPEGNRSVCVEII